MENNQTEQAKVGIINTENSRDNVRNESYVPPMQYIDASQNNTIDYNTYRLNTYCINLYYIDTFGPKLFEQYDRERKGEECCT